MDLNSQYAGAVNLVVAAKSMTGECSTGMGLSLVNE
jgi:hypothetical protein